MHLYLSSHSAINSIYSTGSGNAIYKVDTPPVSLYGTRRTIIRRAVETVDGVWLGDQEKVSYDRSRHEPLFTLIQLQSLPPSSALLPLPQLEHDPSKRRYEGHFAHLAQIEYSALKSPLIVHDGKKLRADKLFRGQGWSWYGLGRHQVFRASDGCEYRWVISSRNPKLVSNDKSKTVIARFHRSNSELSFKGPCRPSLEIYPEGEHIMDDILITFVYLRDGEEY